MITPERIAEIEKDLFNKHGYGMVGNHDQDCAALYPNTQKCNCGKELGRELLSELKDSLSREKKHQEEIARFASKLTEWIEDQIA